MAWGWGESEEAHRQVQEGNHEGHLSHQLIAGAATYAGMKAWEDHQRKNGEEVEHGTAKALLASFAVAGAERLAETKGLDKVDEMKAKKHAKENAEKMYEEHYEQNGPRFNPREHPPHPSFERNRFDEHPHPQPHHHEEAQRLDRW
ncbi:hypothetical protein BDV36DRAFT_294312 [Aspergillus pseudocaelatus]|uniref:CipC-like antibiotic response protein n=1 Tax=Aspergillus pseudocaelatus TaxID=1825620 RepID=A0ABQ6WQB4_9EURO|nr:hypothetical protein BDV36DRAFT_294312 [Aspergillus pseudocaelatus]